MNGAAMPAALRERLGSEGAEGLVEVLRESRREWRDEVIDMCGLRFDRRLVEETSKLRSEMVHMDAALRQDLAKLGAELRVEMAALGAELRTEMAALGAELRTEIGALRSELRTEIATLGASLKGDLAAGRAELVKWCFLFWIGQVVAIAGIMGLALRLVRP